MDDRLSAVRVLIIASDPLARAGLAGLVSMADNCDVVGQISDGDELNVYQPDLILWDMGWDTTDDDIAALQASLSTMPTPQEGGPPIIALSATPDTATQLWASGIQGILPRAATPEQIAGAAHAATVGLLTFDDTFIEELIPQASLEPSYQPLEELTPRENDVLQLLAEGLANKVIARQLDISEHTVKFHVNAILSKLGATSRTQAVVRATQAGLIIL